MAVDALELFLASHLAAGHSPRTVEWYRYEVERFYGWIDASGLTDHNWVKPEIIEQYLAASRLKGNQPATMAGHYRALAGFFAWLVKRGYVQTSPLADIPIPKVPKKQPRRAELAEYAALVDSIPMGDWIDLRDRLVIQVLFLCGLRLAECAKLSASDFRTDQHLLLVRQGKGGHDRFVPLLPAVERAFKMYLFVRPEWPGTDHLFLGADGAGKARGDIAPGGIRQMVKRRCQSAGVRVLNPHSFRHGLAMMLLNRGGADMSLVQKILGHSQIGTTSRNYAEWLTDGLIREFTEKMKGVGGA